MNGDFDRAYEYMERSNPTLTGDTDIAIDAYNVYSAIMLAFIQQKRDRPAEARKLLAKAQPVIERLPRLGYAGHGIRDVQILSMQGRPNAAMEALIEAVDEGFVSSQAFDVWSFDAVPPSSSASMSGWRRCGSKSKRRVPPATGACCSARQVRKSI